MKKLLFMASLFLVATTTQAQITLISQGTPAKIAQNAEVKVSITYTSTVEINEWQIQLFPANADGTVNWGGPDPGIYIGNNYTGSTPPIEGKSLPIAAEPRTLTFTSYCDGAKVPVGTDNYIWFVKLKGHQIFETSIGFLYCLSFGFCLKDNIFITARSATCGQRTSHAAFA